VSATPIALDRNPGDLYSIDSGQAEEAHREAAATIARACINIGLPTPAAVTVLPSITMPGVAKARQFPPFPTEPGKVRRVKVHAVVRFHEPVLGPVVLGAGRFLGMGLMRPFDNGETT
jgi:CRISPR-associated protein Csb2